MTVDHGVPNTRIPIEYRRLRITILEDMLGTIPKNEQLFTDYIASKNPKVVNGEVTVKELDEMETIPQESDTVGYTGYHMIDGKPALYDYHFKGFLKESGNNIKGFVDTGNKDKGAGLKALRSKIDNFVFVYPRIIVLADQIDYIKERPLRAQTPRGERIALARSDTILAGASFEITVGVLPHKELTWEVIEQLLDYGYFKGLGQWRNAGWGRFSWEYVDFDPEKAKAEKKAKRTKKNADNSQETVQDLTLPTAKA